MSEKEVAMNGESLKETSTEWMDQTKKNNLSHKSGKKKGKKGDENREVDFRGKARTAGTYTATVVTYCVDRK